MCVLGATSPERDPVDHKEGEEGKRRPNSLDLASMNPVDLARQANRIVRAETKKLFDLKRKIGRPPPSRPKEQKTNWTMTKVAIDNRNGIVPYLEHRRIYEFAFDVAKSPHRFRSDIVRKFLWRLELRGVATARDFEWADLAECMSVKEGDTFRLKITDARKTRPSSPATSKRVTLERANQRKGKR
jgi:hypothetical protein